MKRKGGFLLFLSSCIPGCGQMHQGYMKRGFSLLAVFTCIIAVAAITDFGQLAIFLPLVWLYAFFDSYNLHGQTDEEAANNPDDYLLRPFEKGDKQLFTIRWHKILGWVLIVIGAFALYNVVINYLRYENNWIPDWVYNLLHYDLPRLIVTALIIALGVWFIRGPKKKKTAEEEFTAYRPCTEHEKEETENHGDGESGKTENNNAECSERGERD